MNHTIKLAKKLDKIASDLENKIYLHISNGGVSFEVVDSGNGPLIRVSASTFGHHVGGTEVFTTKDALKAIGEMFLRAAEKEYSEAYCIAAQYENPKDPRWNSVQTHSSNT